MADLREMTVEQVTDLLKLVEREVEDRSIAFYQNEFDAAGVIMSHAIRASFLTGVTSGMMETLDALRRYEVLR